ncbi:winged helix-turn-helix domain-containing protein [Marinimicrobium sp. ABcell2]|uniref:winged helix-turn-helix domain-containing protein n=1 Tax=Marinimicrobium sp. ABcell2 TaxID=3069751 RepID=UPI0027B6EB80|nr:winged helix-turn-helix domain-containing protein [Marinimicrobium sp. ABcell2]MDQ2078429.1 winged helix-turn-helix domain-containing protein [Marinimicrobium sp. ABcell2]
MSDEIDTFRRSSFTLGEMRVFPSRNELEAHGRTVRLQPKVMDVLCYLACHHERVIPKEELIAQVWPGRIVTHGSVQKSINLLRKALAELLGDQELVAHYSKKGYQLQLVPADLELEQGTAEHRTRPARHLRYVGLAGVVVVLVVLAAYLIPARHTLFISEHHRTDFAAVSAYTSEVGHERAGEPHPNNQHLVYIRDTFAEGNQTESELVIRDSDGQDWVLATSSGAWVDLAWSPNGEFLAAVELMYEGGPMLRPNLYTRAAQLYDLHVFSLDLNEWRVLETHRLSQWQGRINSITWWDDDVLELVATQGDGALNRRYRYAVQAQRLAALESLNFVSNPLISKVHNGRTAIASLHDGRTRIDFLSEDQSRFASRQLDYAATDISWVPDGSGVLVHSSSKQMLTLVRRDGKVREIPLPYRADTFVSRPRYSADGQRLYFAEERPQADIWAQNLEGEKTPITQNTYLNYAPRYSPDGTRLVYISVRNNQTQIWLVEDGRERQLFRHHNGQRINDILWAHDGQLIYTAGDQAFVRSLNEAGRTSVRLSDAAELNPIAYHAQSQDLYTLKLTGESQNLWRINIDTGEERQLTFGSVASAVGNQSGIYFQYVGQSGLWVWRAQTAELENIAQQFPRDSQLLRVDEAGLFYTYGGSCRESDIYFFRFSDQQSHRRLPRDNARVSTTAFHPDQGALFTPCTIMESDIMMLE